MGIKKKKKSKKQNKTAPNRRIQKTGMESSTQPLSDLHGEITEDIVYFFRSFPDAMRSPQTATETLIKAVLPTEKIAMEPEFDDIFGDPISCTLIYSETISKMEVNWKSFGDLPPELKSSIRQQIMEETVSKFINDSLRFEILDGLNQYRLRKKQAGDKMEAGIAAALQLVLKDEKNNPIWPKIGLLLGIAHNSISLGLEIKDSYGEIIGKDKVDIPESDHLLLLDEQKKFELLKKVPLNIGGNPRLNKFFHRQMKRVYDEGINSLLEGKLYFGFLTTAELNKIFEHIVKSTGSLSTKPLSEANAFLAGLGEKKQTKLISSMKNFIKEIFTPEKINQMQEKLNSILREPGDFKHWEPFIFLIKNPLEDKDALENHINFFVCITLGELAAFQGGSRSS